MLKPVTVQYEQDPETSWWTASVPEEPAVVSQGKTLAEAYKHVRNAYKLMQGSRSQPVIFTGGYSVWRNRYDLSRCALELVKRETDLRIRLLEIQNELERTTDDAVRVLNLEKKLSYGRVGLLLGITRQRVEQISQRLRKSPARHTRQA